MGRDKIISTVLIIVMALMIIIFFLFKVFNLSRPTILSGDTVLGIDVSRHQGNINPKNSSKNRYNGCKALSLRK